MRLSVCDSHGVRQCALQGLEIMQVEILSGKELTNPPEVSFELLLVMYQQPCDVINLRIQTAVLMHRQLCLCPRAVSDTLESAVMQSMCGRELPEKVR